MEASKETHRRTSRKIPHADELTQKIEHHAGEGFEGYYTYQTIDTSAVCC